MTDPVPQRDSHEDTTAHARIFSDQTLKHDTEPVQQDDLDDTSAHGRLLSDRTLKHDVEPVEQDDDA